MNITKTVAQSVDDKVLRIPITIIIAPTCTPNRIGKYFRVWFINDTCIKIARVYSKEQIITRLADLATVYSALEVKCLVPRIYSLLISANPPQVGMIVERIEMLNMVDYSSCEFQEFYSRLSIVAGDYYIFRTPYEDLPNQNSFLLETRGKGNLGKKDNNFLLLDVDLQCTTKEPQLCRSRTCLEARISKVLSAATQTTCIEIEGDI